MSLTSSLSSALSGLSAASRSLDIVSANVANAMTEGYAKREIQLASQTVGGAGAGVQVVGVTRVVDERTLADFREANANAANSSDQADAWMRIENAIGLPTDDSSLTARLDQFEAALIAAASRPDETVRLDDAVNAAGAVVDTLHAVGDEIAELRMEADADIANMVEDLNTKLEQVETLNWQIFSLGNGGQDVAALMDERQRVVDGISEIIPVRQVEREGNQIALFTPGGATLIDGPAGELSFTPHTTITADMTIENGLLSGLELNGIPLQLDSTYGGIDGGRLAAAFETRDTIAVEAQEGLDAIARDLIERFQDPALDPTIASTGLGLFTDGGIAFTPADEAGIANRIEVNSAVDPAAGGESWRLRDGIGAAIPGSVGDATLLSALSDRMGVESVVASGPSAGLSRSVSGLASDFLSSVDSSYRVHEDALAFHSARAEMLSYELAEDGVDTDDEMQQLLLIEQIYAANARVVQTVDQLMQELLEI